jgi:flagellar biosynthetic protein FliR
MIDQLDAEMFSRYLTNFLLILLRSGIFVALLPVIGGKQLPAQFRIGFAVFIAMLLTPVVHFEAAEQGIPLLVLKEILIGIALGLTVRFIFMAVNMAGTFISHTMGMSIARVFNPEIGQSSHIAETYGVMAMLMFLATDAHHDLIYVFVKSFEVLPAGRAELMPVVSDVMAMVGGLFVLAIKIGAPVVVGLMIAHILAGFLYKAAPQMNIFFVALPLNIFLGFLLMILSIPVFEYVFRISLSDLRTDMIELIMKAKG